MHSTDIDNEFESICSLIMTKIRKYQAEGTGWTFDSVIEQNINILKYKPPSPSSYSKSPKALNRLRKTFINIQNSDDECLKCCLARILQIVIQQEFKKITKILQENVSFNT